MRIGYKVYDRDVFDIIYLFFNHPRTKTRALKLMLVSRALRTQLPCNNWVCMKNDKDPKFGRVCVAGGRTGISEGVGARLAVGEQDGLERGQNGLPGGGGGKSHRFGLRPSMGASIWAR